VGRELAEDVSLTPFQMHQPQLVDECVHGEVERLVSLTACPLSQGIDKESLARAFRAYYNSEPRVTYVATCGLFGDITSKLNIFFIFISPFPVSGTTSKYYFKTNRYPKILPHSF
jgi:hypothetical protein